MIYFKFILFTLLKLGLLLTLPFAMLVIPLFTRAEGHDKPLYTWGGWYGTYDNPPQGRPRLCYQAMYVSSPHYRLEGLRQQGLVDVAQ